MESTIGVGPSCLLKISFQDHQDANLSKPYVCQESPKACGDPSLSSRALRVQHMKVGDSFFSFFVSPLATLALSCVPWATPG